MKYIVWIKSDYEGYAPSEPLEEDAVKLAIVEAVKLGKEPILTVKVDFSVGVAITPPEEIPKPPPPTPELSAKEKYKKGVDSEAKKS